MFIISSAVLGLIGGFYTGFYGGVSLTIFDFNTLLLLLAMIVVGGVGSAKGAIVGTALLLYIDRTYADLDNPAWRFVWIGIIMFGITLGTTRGIVGLPAQIRGYIQRRRARRATGRGRARAHPVRARSPGSLAAVGLDRGLSEAVLARVDSLRDELVEALSAAVRIESVNPKYPGQVYDEVVGGEGEVAKLVGGDLPRHRAARSTCSPSSRAARTRSAC